MPTTNPPRGHIRTLDGLRGVAILMVLAIHFYPKWLIADTYPVVTMIAGRIVEPGRYGVELFFVLSGFLITGILIDTKPQRRFLVKFYARRVLRIFPLYYTVLAVIFFILPHIVDFDAGAKLISNKQGWLWTYMGNWPEVWSWDQSSLFNLNHFWSLCVEEHFYLVWPIFIALLSKKNVFHTACLLIIISLLCRSLSVILPHNPPPIVLWPTLQSLDGLAIGSILAVALREPTLSIWAPKGDQYRRGLLIFSVASVGYFLIPRRIHHPFFDVFGETVVVVCSGLLLLGVLRLKPNARAHALMTSPVLMAFGKYSYGLYVIHGILRPFLERNLGFQSLPSGHGLAFIWVLLYYLLATGISFGLAVASYQLLEKRFLNLKRFFNYEPCSNQAK